VGAEPVTFWTQSIELSTEQPHPHSEAIHYVVRPGYDEVRIH